jgi:hypothetical protein
MRPGPEIGKLQLFPKEYFFALRDSTYKHALILIKVRKIRALSQRIPSRFSKSGSNLGAFGIPSPDYHNAEASHPGREPKLPGVSDRRQGASVESAWHVEAANIAYATAHAVQCGAHDCIRACAPLRTLTCLAVKIWVSIMNWIFHGELRP